MSAPGQQRGKCSEGVDALPCAEVGDIVPGTSMILAAEVFLTE